MDERSDALDTAVARQAGMLLVFLFSAIMGAGLGAVIGYKGAKKQYELRIQKSEKANSPTVRPCGPGQEGHSPGTKKGKNPALDYSEKFQDGLVAFSRTIKF
jgi:hypothetical protein